MSVKLPPPSAIARSTVAFQPKPFTALERRHQRFLSTLFKEAEKIGYKVTGESNLTFFSLK